MVQKHFGYQDLLKMLESLDGTKITYRNAVKVSLIKSGLRALKNETKQMSENEIKSAKPEIVVNLAEKILEFNNQNQEGQKLKILTPNQMLSRLPITLAQLKAANNSEKLKNEIRQLLRSLHCLKKLSKTICKHLVSII